MKRWIGVLLGVVFAVVLLSYGVTQEVPLSGVRGKLVMQENNRPLAHALVTFTPMSERDQEIIRTRYKRTGDDGSFALPDIPAGAYEMEVSATNHEFKKRFIWLEEGKQTDLETLALKPGDPYLRLYASQRVFTPGEAPGLELHGFVDIDQIRIKVVSLSIEYLYREGGLSNALWPLANEPRRLEQAGKVVQTIDHKITGRDNEGAFVESLRLPKINEGFYLVTCSAKKLHEATFINVTNLAMVTKSSPGEALAFVTDITTGKPVADANVQAWRGGGLASIGRTDADGIVRTGLGNAEKPVLVARRGASVAMVGFYNGEDEDRPIHITSYTDRPIYRPGDEIHYKGIVRVGEGDDMRLPGPSTLTVELHNGDGDVIATEPATLGAHGTYSGVFRTDPEAEPGDWTIVSKLGKETDNLYVPISAYRKPEYTISVTSTEPYFVAGDRAAVKVKAEYYFGGPVAGAKVTASVYRTPWFGSLNPSDDDDEVPSYDDSFDGGEYSEEVEATTNANGEAIIAFDTRAEGDPQEFPTDFKYNVIVSVADEGDKYFDGQGAALVVRGKFDLNVATDTYVVKPGATVPFSITTRDHDGKPLPNQTVRLTHGYQRWTDKSSFFEALGEQTVTTNADGKATVNIDATDSGPLELHGLATDASGNRIASEASTWVSGEDAAWYPSLGNFKLTLDKKQYQPGDQATVLLQAEKPGGSALVTVEGNRVLWQKVVPITSTSVTVTLPVIGSYAPNVGVTAAYVRNKQFYTADRELEIDRPDRNLNVEVTPNKEVYEPGDQAIVQIKTTDDEGTPTPANLSLAVVDESIYALRNDSTDILTSLYPHRWSNVSTSYSFPDVYLDGGDKGGPDLRIRKKFQDTAYWNPNVETDSKGNATVSFILPDNLTQWRATAIGVTDRSSAGMNKALFRARKPLMVRVLPPSYLTQYDEQHLSVVVTNDTGQDQDVNVAVASTGVELEGQASQTIRVIAGQPASLDFTLRAPSAGRATITAKAWVTGGAGDAVEQSLPIHPFGREVFETLAGEASPDADLAVNLLPTAASSKGELTIRVAPTLAGGIVQALPSLINFPYGCVEQTMSRFMPAMVISNAIGNLNLNVDGSEKLPDIARRSYQRLGSMQTYSGGWGWWEYGDPDPLMTALVLDGIDRARQAGYPPRYVDVNRALTDAVRLIDLKPRDSHAQQSWERDRIYLAYVLARYGKREIAAKVVANTSLAKMGAAEAALLILAAHEVGNHAKVQEGFNALAAQVQESPTMANWAPQQYAWGAEPTALALTAYLTVRPEDPIIPKVVRDLMVRRKGDMWTSTRDTSYALVALSKYLEQHPEELNPPTSHRDVSVNGTPVTLISDGNGGATATVPVENLKAGANQILIRGSAKSFYGITLRQFDVQRSLAAQPAKGLTVTRTYHLLEPRRLQNGTTRLLPSERTIDQVKSGDIVRVELKINSDVPREFMLIEDPMPSNCRSTERGDVDTYDWGWWWSNTVVRDDRIAFFARWLPKGESTISYNLRAESPGISGALPTHIENMYDPGERASNASGSLEVLR